MLYNFLIWLKAYFLKELEPEPEPVKKIPGAGQKRTGSTTLILLNFTCMKMIRFDGKGWWGVNVNHVHVVHCFYL